MINVEEWKPDERTVRAVVAMMRTYEWNIASDLVAARFLPADPATKLVDEFGGSNTYAREPLLAFAKWLIETGRVK